MTCSLCRPVRWEIVLLLVACTYRSLSVTCTCFYRSNSVTCCLLIQKSLFVTCYNRSDSALWPVTHLYLPQSVCVWCLSVWLDSPLTTPSAPCNSITPRTSSHKSLSEVCSLRLGSTIWSRLKIPGLHQLRPGQLTNRYFSAQIGSNLTNCCNSRKWAHWDLGILWRAVLACVCVRCRALTESLSCRAGR